MLTIGRVEILAEPACGGHRLGAPATEDEVREMAREILRLKVKEATLARAIGRLEGALDEYRKTAKTIADAAFVTTELNSEEDRGG